MANNWSQSNSEGTIDMGIWGEESVTEKKVTTIAPEVKPIQTPKNHINIIYASSSSVYGDSKKFPLTENDKRIGYVCLAIFILCFIPAPFQT